MIVRARGDVVIENMTETEPDATLFKVEVGGWVFSVLGTSLTLMRDDASSLVFVPRIDETKR